MTAAPPQQLYVGENEIHVEDLRNNPWRILGNLLFSKTDEKIVRFIKYGALLTVIGTYLLFGLWPCSSFILGSAHIISQIIFDGSYAAILIGGVSVLTTITLLQLQWIKRDVEKVII